jgi:hypothetical protein
MYNRQLRVVTGDENSHNVAHACCKIRLKWVPGVKLDHAVSRGVKYGGLVLQVGVGRGVDISTS